MLFLKIVVLIRVGTLFDTKGENMNAREFLNDFEAFCKVRGVTPPHFHVSDPLRNKEELDAVFAGNYHGYIRLGGHPDHLAIEKWLAEFESGAKFRVRSDGMGAVTMALHGALNARGGSEFIRILPLYGGTTDEIDFLTTQPRYNVSTKTLYASDPHLFQKLYDAVSEKTAAIIFENFGNPTLTFINPEKIDEVIRAHPRGKPISICDNTFLFGIFHPLAWGIHVAVNSGTKHMVGESAWSIGSCGVSREFLKECPRFWEMANTWTNLHGGTLGPFEAWVTHTFCLPSVKEHIIRHSENALRVAQFLEKHPRVERVFYAGLSSYPDRESVVRYLEPLDGKRVFGGMVSFSVKTNNTENAQKFLFHLTAHSHIEYKASLGGPDDMIESPDDLSHKHLSPEDKERCDITPNLIRLSVGRIRKPEETMDALDRSLYATI